MNKSKIEWCDYTWNPITGCLHGCIYCYAERISKRFAPKGYECSNCLICPDCVGKDIRNKCPNFHQYRKCNKIHVLENEKFCFHPKKHNTAFPYGFEPTLYKYRMNEPRKKISSRIFVCSMADLFGEWIPDTWIEDIFTECSRSPQHCYMFLTKNPLRYQTLAEAGKLPINSNMYYGTTITNETQEYFASDQHKTFLSIEPIQSVFSLTWNPMVNWVIIGQETGNRKNRIIAKPEWIKSIYDICKSNEIPVFMKNNLSGVIKNLIQENVV